MDFSYDLRDTSCLGKILLLCYLLFSAIKAGEI